MRCLSESFLHIDWDEEYDILYLEWYYYPGQEAYRESLNSTLNLARQKEIRFFIANVKQLKAIEPTEISWYIENWFPELLTLPIQKIAFILSTNNFEESAAGFIQKLDIPVLPFEMEFFTQIEKAYAWIKNNPLAGPRLYTE
ncbi:hypothetical protein HUW51_09990 [Adhaeribacter swui]|uniref:STAS/SEC14 domain-containing protein n=1 Tax=Adhaeribacter swui TaxID=2086471 RepID=A0A7G7G7B3_9BACT|nr:hypothetical protein [Adhaeribacter swui]QNF33047.1 hypothetical protein HUW51_09990 [Adhaeribacter swui]